ncbi:glycosyltransferase [Microbacterium horticulturae]|uniref:D-inositol 3-phosphate glycosyltransferase n=1 Tax=Microbacterium horticulturae TaxID=3028316 RepID=A0ABY8BYD0_9MICO|nr:glycosyltransferase [Microbacterium sp. KACC 23027]WEG09201.1 glycosyltransferase [Microbacterium sp. KACC 23027]
MRVLRIAHHAVVSAWRERERRLINQGVDVTLISAAVWNEGGRDVALEAEEDGFVRAARTVGRHPSVFVCDPRPIWRAIGEKPDLIDLHEEPNAMITAETLLIRWLRRCRAPYVLYSAQNIAKRYPIPFRWIERVSLRGAAAVYVCNNEAGRILHEKGLRAPAVLIPLGVDTAVFAPAERAAPHTEPVVGYIGRLQAHKGVDVLLRAAASRPHWQLRITGDGPQRAELEALARTLGIADRVRFLGFTTDEDLASRYRELDVLAVPSLPTTSWLEQFCRVAVEAMASGVPVVASDTGAIPDVVGDSGILVPPGDAAALVRAIDETLSPERWTQLRERGLARAPQFAWDAVAAAQREMYAEVLGETGNAYAPDVLVVAYGSPDGLDESLAALSGRLPITVVDNSSLPETQDVANRHGARYIDAGGNRGFAGGVNIGLRALADAGQGDRDVLLLNPDARIDADAVAVMQRALHVHPRVAAVGATQTEPDSGARVRVWWPFPSPWGAWLEAVGLGPLNRAKGFAIGSALLLNARAIAELGGLDERFFLYAEETDWQYRARRHGWSIRVAEVSATHEGAGTGGDPSIREGHFYASGELYIRKHYGTLGWQVFRAAGVCNAAVRSLLLRGARGAAARRRLRLFVAGPVAARSAADDLPR